MITKHTYPQAKRLTPHNPEVPSLKLALLLTLCSSIRYIGLYVIRGSLTNFNYFRWQRS